MAVSNEQAPNLSGSYQTIISQLQNRAQMESTRENPYDVGTAVATHADKELTKARDFAQSQAAAGKVLVTDDKIKALTTKLNQQLPKDKQVGPDEFSSYKGLYVTPDEMQSHLEQKLFESSFKNADEAAAAAVAPKEAAKEVFAPTKTAEQVLIHEYNDGKMTRDEFLKSVETLKSASTHSYADRPQRSKDNFGRDTVTYADGTFKVLNGAPKPTPAGELAKEQSQLHPAELKTFKDSYKTLNDKILSTSTDNFKNFDKLQTAIDSNNPAAFFNSKIGLVLAGGISAGRMAQGEIIQDGGTRSFMGKMAQKIETLKEGDWTPENKKLISEYIKDLRGSEVQYLRNQIDRETSSTLSQMPDPGRIDPEFIKNEFSKPVMKYLGDDLVNVINAQGIPGTIKRSKLDAALKSGYTLAK